MQRSRLRDASSRLLVVSSLVTAPACYQSPDLAAGDDGFGTHGSVPPEFEGEAHAAAPASILVLVEDEDGRPIVSAKIIPHPEPELDGPDPVPVPALPGPARSRVLPGAVLTNSEGLALLQDLGAGRFTFEVQRSGYSSAVGQATLELDSAVSRRVRLLRTRSTTFRADEGLARLEHRGAVVEVMPHGLVYKEGTREEPDPNDPAKLIVRHLAGQPVEGEVQAELAVVHPRTADPASLPGPLFGISPDTGGGGMLISAGMLEFRMSQDGIPVQPAPGAAVKISLRVEDVDVDPRVAAAVAEGRTIPKWYLDPDKGRWIEEGTWTPERGPDGSLLLTAFQTHFTWINVDLVGTPYCHRLVVRDPNGAPKPDEPIQIAESPWHNGKTGPDGTVCMEGPTTIHVNVCGKVVALDPVEGQQTVSACTDGVWNLALNGLLGVWAFEGPYDDANCPITDVYCDIEGTICNANDWRYCDEDPDPEVGLCQNSKQHCIDGTHWSPCAEKIIAVPEVCDKELALDDDCDGQVDNGCDCDDPDEQPCYPGQLEQLDKNKYPEAICAPGTQICQMQGDWDACIGFQMGESEDCSTPNIDEDCDGISMCLGDAAWAIAAEEAPTALQGDAIAVVPGGDVVVGINASAGGAPQLPVLCDQGKNPITALDTDGLLVKYAGDQATCLEVRRIGGPGVSKITAVAVDDLTSVVLVAGHFTDKLDADEGEPNMCGQIMGEPGQPHLFLAMYSPTLQCLWRRKLTEGLNGAAQDAKMVLAPDGKVFLTATFTGTTNFASTNIVPAPNLVSGADNDGLVMEVLALNVPPFQTGEVTSYATIGAAGNSGNQVPLALALHGDDLAVGGWFTEQFGTSMGVMQGQEWFVRRYMLVGGHLPLNNNPEDLFRTALPEDQRVTALAFSAAGNLIAGGYSNTTETGILNCDTAAPDDAGDHGFVAHDLRFDKPNQVYTSSACARLYGANSERIIDLALIEDPNQVPPKVDVVAVGNVIGIDAAPVYADVFADGQSHGVRTDQSDLELGDKQDMDGLAFRVSFTAPGCQWVQRMPEHLDGSSPAKVADVGSEQCPWRVATRPGGASFLTGWFKQGMGFASGDAPVNLAGDDKYRAFVSKMNP